MILFASDMDDLPPFSPPAAAYEGDFGAAFAKMFLTLAALILLLGVTYWFLRKLIQQRMQRGNAQAMIQIVEKRMISPKTTLYLIEVEGKRSLVAESHLEVRKLDSFPPET